MFRLEKAFDIKIERGELIPMDVLEDTAYVSDGKVNAAGIAKLKERMPFADLSGFEADPNVQNLGNQLTVQDMCNFVEYKLKKALEDVASGELSRAREPKQLVVLATRCELAELRQLA